MTDYPQTQPAPQWRGPRTRAVPVTIGGRRTIVYHREGALPERPAALPLRTRLAPPAPPTIPATAAGVAAHFRASRLLKRPARPPSPSPAAAVADAPTPEAFRAMRERLDLSQRDVAAAAGVSRSLVSELEAPQRRPRLGRRRSDHRERNPQAVAYAAWLRLRVAQSGAGE